MNGERRGLRGSAARLAPGLAVAETRNRRLRSRYFDSKHDVGSNKETAWQSSGCRGPVGHVPMTNSIPPAIDSRTLTRWMSTAAASVTLVVLGLSVRASASL